VEREARDLASEHFDVVIVGAGLSGIGAAHHLQRNCPGKSFAILEGRASIGGTWDLFRYPGIRSDSDMYTMGYSFRPWTDAKAIADGPSILNYIRDTAKEADIDRHIRFNHWVGSRDLVVARRAVDRRNQIDKKRGSIAKTVLHLQFPVHVLGLLPLCRGLLRRNSREPSASKAASFIRSIGPKISITRTSVSS
jgi:cation diffusion facilitator CzcD-associated flavoprotein CzcO